MSQLLYIGAEQGTPGVGHLTPVEICEQCGASFTRRPSEKTPNGRPWKHSFCGRVCYTRWRADRHLLVKAEWLRFQREVWGTAPFGQRDPAGARQYARKYEVIARDVLLPERGFSDIDDLTATSNQFFVDFIATHAGRRVLVDATVKLKAYIPDKSRLAMALRMPLFIVHVSPKHPNIYHINEVAEGRVISRVPAAFIRLLSDELRWPTAAET